MTGNGYEYGNTRVRAMRSRLLDPTDYDEMITAGSLDRVVAMLADTDYRPDVEAALVRARGLRRLDELTRTNLARSLRAVASFYEGEPRRHVDLLLGRWDLRNLRSLLRLPDVPRESPDLSGLLVPAGRLDEAALTELAAQPDISTLVDLLVVWGIPSPQTTIALTRARATYVAEGDVSVVESALDKAFAEEMRSVLGEENTGPATTLRAEIDVRNLETALRLRSARLDREPGWRDVIVEYVPGGMIRPGVWAQVSMTDSAGSVAELLTSRRLPAEWDAVMRSWAAHGDLMRLREDLQRATTTAAVSRFVTGDALGFDIPLAFVFAKEAEVRNLRLIGRGIAHGIPIDEVEAHLEVAA